MSDIFHSCTLSKQDSAHCIACLTEDNERLRAEVRTLRNVGVTLTEENERLRKLEAKVSEATRDALTKHPMTIVADVLHALFESGMTTPQAKVEATKEEVTCPVCVGLRYIDAYGKPCTYVSPWKYRECDHCKGLGSVPWPPPTVEA